MPVWSGIGSWAELTGQKKAPGVNRGARVSGCRRDRPADDDDDEQGER